MDIGVTGRAVVERRAAARARTTHLGAVLSARLRSGAEIVLIDLSLGGALIESGRRLLPGARVDLQVQTCGGRFVLAGRLVRAEVSAIRSDEVRYRAGLAFDSASAGSAGSLVRALQGSGYPTGRAGAAVDQARGPQKPHASRTAADGIPFGSGRSLSQVLG